MSYSLLPHLHDVLVQKLRDASFASLSPDEAYARLCACKNFEGLRSLCFVRTKVYEALPEKRRKYYSPVNGRVGDEYPGGVPGFPNKLRRECFDAAWSEAREAREGSN